MPAAGLLVALVALSPAGAGEAADSSAPRRPADAPGPQLTPDTICQSSDLAHREQEECKALMAKADDDQDRQAVFTQFQDRLSHRERSQQGQGGEGMPGGYQGLKDEPRFSEIPGCDDNALSMRDRGDCRTRWLAADSDAERRKIMAEYKGIADQNRQHPVSPHIGLNPPIEEGTIPGRDADRPR